MQPPSESRIRRATPVDAIALARLRYRFRAEIGTLAEPEETFVRRCAAWMAARLESGQRPDCEAESGQRPDCEAESGQRPDCEAESGSSWRCWLLESRDRQILGNLWLQAIEKIPNPVNEPELHAYLTNFYVVPGARRAGLGSRLLAEALAWCRSRAVDAVILWPTAESRTLYERHGFAVREDMMELRRAPDRRRW